MNQHSKHTLSNIFKHTLFVFITMLFVIVSMSYFVKTEAFNNNRLDSYQELNFDGTYDWEVTPDEKTSSDDYLTYSYVHDNYVLTNQVQSLLDDTLNKFIRFDTAEELYQFSIDVSYIEQATFNESTNQYDIDEDIIEALLSLDYVLGRNIDYSEMKSKAFIPIGYRFVGMNSETYDNVFTGTFDGQGFEIQNLYLAGYDQFVIGADPALSEILDEPTASYYAMFTINEGTVKNLGLINPNLELLQVNENLKYLSNLVGQNDGIVDHVYVIDSRESVTEAGIRYRVGDTGKIFSAAGIVHTNNNMFTNAYYVSKVVVNGNYINKFEVEPLVYENNGLVDYLVYDQSLYLDQVVVGSSIFDIETPQNGVSDFTYELKSLQDSSLVHPSSSWYFYEDDGYPLLQGLDFDAASFSYIIDDAVDLAFFPRILGFNTVLNNTPFTDSNYHITSDIDMGVLADGIYQVPNQTFNGVLYGTNPAAVNNGDHYYIHHLTIDKFLLTNSKIYAGLFSVLGNGSQIKDLNITHSSITINGDSNSYSYKNYVGGLAGEMIAASIQDVHIDIDIEFINSLMGSLSVGGIIGEGSGSINRVSTYGDIYIGEQNFSGESTPIDGVYYIGGAIGSTTTAKLTANEIVNQGTLTSLGTTGDIYLSNGQPLTVQTGGVIGQVNFGNVNKHHLSGLTNNGSIYLLSVGPPMNGSGVQYTGGIFGRVSGVVPKVEKDDIVQFGRFYNGSNGDINYINHDTDVDVYASGIGIVDFDGTFEMGLLKNYGSFNLDINGSSLLNNHFHYASIIYDIGINDFTLSRVYNYGDYNYNNTAFDSTYGLVESINDNNILLRYSANYGDIFFLSNDSGNPLVLNNDVTISGITTEPNVEYKNVHNEGNIFAVNLNMQNNELFIAGFTKVLEHPYSIINGLNTGNIVFANISGTGNIYVAGLVNINRSGDLHNYALDVEQPSAEFGIINSVNSGDISTTFSSTTYGVNGTNNTFVGGLVTLNKKTIQDSSNLGNISIVNTSTSGVSTFDNDINQYFAGLVNSYSAGVVSGGVAAMSIDGESRIYDTGNSGDVLAKSRNFARAGGVLGVSLFDESEAGGITSGQGLVNNIENSVLSNGLNFGNISAITQQIGSYSTSLTNQSVTLLIGDPPLYSDITYSETTTVGTNDRPSVYSAAGGVIGYGLSIMRNMLNHGSISSTDVAGGIVGATYVLGGSSQPITVVNITTAVNYGVIKSISTANFSAISDNAFNIVEVANYYMSDGNSFIYPSGFTREMPRGKRGFGGIFGRLQRGTNGVMTSSGGSFDFIVNANPNIDLIGRLDQVFNFSSSLRYFRFNDAIYYSANDNDTTQTVFSGFIYTEGGEVTNIDYLGYTRERYWWWYYYYFTYRITVQTDTFYSQRGIQNTSIDQDPIITTFDEVISQFNNSNPPGSSYTVGETVSDGNSYLGTDQIPWVTENPNDPLLTDPDTEYIYDINFEMRTNPSLTEYIYYAEADLLADRFQSTGTNPRPNGMYVLSTSAGETYGSVLPNNIRLDNIRLVDESEDVSFNKDYQMLLDIEQLDIDPEVLQNYNNMKQTTYNDKSNLIDDELNQAFIIQETSPSENQLIATDIPNFLNSGIDLGIDYDQKTITFAISMEAFISTQSTASFEIINALTSSNAMIGIRESESPLSMTALQDSLYQEAYMKIASGVDTKANLNINLPNYNIQTPQLLTLGYFSVFSESFFMDPANGTYEFSNSDYFTDYRIDIYFMPNFTQSSFFTGVESVEFNQASPINIVDSDPLDLRTIDEVNPDGSLTLNFNDGNQLLIPGYDFKRNFDLYYQTGQLVDPDYYQVESNPVDALGDYSITFTFLNNIRGGDYYLEYSFYPHSRLYRVDFSKSLSSQGNIIDFTYDTEENSIPDNITSNFSSTMSLGNQLTIDETINNFSIYQSGGADYLYDLYQISYMTPGSLQISPFARVISARRVSLTYDAITGYKTVELEYVIEAEDGTTSTYSHTITERPIFIESVLKNGNEVSLDDAFAIREDEQTEFTVDLGFDEPLVETSGGSVSYPYGNPLTVINVVITGADFQGNPIANIQGITYSYNEFMNINMDISTMPGVYNFEITYQRTATDHVTIETELLGGLSMTKREGTDAYLTDIRFSQFANETFYPDIEITNDAHEILTTPYNPQAYFNGFDYDGAKEADIQYFRVDGKVSNVPLNSYQPIFLDFLPIGSTIAKEYWNGTAWVYTEEIPADASDLERAVLSADFTAYPDTLSPAPTGQVLIRYRVSSEDGLSMVYYDVTVSDVTYNVTFIFDLYYCSDGSKTNCVLANDSIPFNNQLVIINMQNIITDGTYNLQGAIDPDEYPSFTSVESLENKTTQFYYTSDADYIYRFGRNKSYYYNIYLDLPLDSYLNDLYTYDIEFEVGESVYTLNDAGDYAPGLQGKYFYIEDSIFLRTRRFDIYIYPIDSPANDIPFGIFDFFKSWGDNE